MGNQKDNKSSNIPHDEVFEASLKRLRREIDKVNESLITLLNARAHIVREIAELRHKHHHSHMDSRREEAQLADISKYNRGPFADQTLQNIFGQIFQASKELAQQRQRQQWLSVRGQGQHCQRAQDSIFDLTGLKVGGSQAPLLLAGASAIESEKQFADLAQQLVSRGLQVIHGNAYQPQPKPQAYQGLGIDGLILGGEIARQFGLLFMTQVSEAADVAVASEHADILQVGPQQMHNYVLLQELGRGYCPVVLTRDPAASLDDWLRSADYILAAGNAEVILREGGSQAPNLALLAQTKQDSHLPVLTDVSSHPKLASGLAQAAVALGSHAVQLTIQPSVKPEDCAYFEECYQTLMPFLQLADTTNTNNTPVQPQPVKQDSHKIAPTLSEALLVANS